MEYAQHEMSQVVMTAWAVLSLIYAEYPDRSVIERAVKLIMSRQKPDGRWDQEDTEGIFNKNCAIDYPGMSVALWMFQSANDTRSIQIHLQYLGFGTSG